MRCGGGGSGSTAWWCVTAGTTKSSGLGDDARLGGDAVLELGSRAAGGIDGDLPVVAGLERRRRGAGDGVLELGSRAVRRGGQIDAGLWLHGKVADEVAARRLGSASAREARPGRRRYSRWVLG